MTSKTSEGLLCCWRRAESLPGNKAPAGAGISGPAADWDGELPHNHGQRAGCAKAPDSSSVKRGQQQLLASHRATQLINVPLSREDERRRVTEK